MQGGESGAPRVGLTSTRVWPGRGKHRPVGGREKERKQIDCSQLKTVLNISCLHDGQCKVPR